MLKTWPFWKTFFTAYLALVAGIWGFGEAYVYFKDDNLKQLLGSNWWIYYYVAPLFIAILFAVWMHSGEEGQAEALDQHNRRVMLGHVENFWVKGVLEKSLHGAALLELGIKEDPSAINYPWTVKRESTNEFLPAGKSMLKIFEDIGAGRSLLILGAPGSGKTTMLLELARQLIERARKDSAEPIPVVFNLASWTEKQTLAEWLAEQLNIVYYVPKKTAPQWVSENKMLLLLDSLDEVKKEIRDKCIEAINQFRNKHGLTSLVVCSRTDDYRATNAKISLEGAITLQPLTSKQMNDYFDKFGKSIMNVRQLLKKDNALRELAKSPLVLSIIILAYKEKKPADLPASTNKEEQRKLLFNTYIKHMFDRPTRTIKPLYSKKKTMHYLNWLAKKMIRYNITAFQIEAMQPHWIEHKLASSLYKLLVGPVFGAISGVVGGITIAYMAGMGISFLGKSFDRWPAGLIGGAIVALSIGLFSSLNSVEITMVDRLKWSWKGFGFELIVSAIFGLSSGLIVRYAWALFGENLELIGALALGLIVGLIFLVLTQIKTKQIEEITRPGQRLVYTFLNFILATILIGFFTGLTLGANNVSIWLSISLITRLAFGLGWGLLLGLLFYGGLSLAQHYILRFVLLRYGLLPRQIISFLEYATELIFLHRVGGSYIFVHRLLMEHFAEIEVEV
jgi:GTPase SAR1 family protein